MSIYILAKKAKARERSNIINSRVPFSLARTNTGRNKGKCSSNYPNQHISQVSYGLRIKQLTTTKCGCKVWKKMPDTTTTQRITELKSDHIYTANKNSTNVAAGTNTNCSTSNTAKSSNSARNGKSLQSTINRVKTCTITKDPPVARTAAQQIEKVKAATRTCAAANPKPVTASRCGNTI